MKKVLLGLIALSFSVIAAEETNLYLKTGVDISGKFKNDNIRGQVSNRAADGDGGFEFVLEGTKVIYPNLEIGIGIALQDHGDPDSINLSYNQEFQTIKNTGYKSLPVYVVTKYNIPLDSSIKPYIKADLGYSYNFGENDITIKGRTEEKVGVSLDSGLYYGIGAGIEYNNFLFEVMHKINKADINYSFNDGEKLKKNYDYSRTTLVVGYKFNF